MRQTDGQTDK